MNPLKDVFKDCDRKSTNHKGEHIFSLHKAFLINVAGYKLPFADKIRGSKLWQIFRGFIFAYEESVTILTDPFSLLLNLYYFYLMC